MGKFKDLTGQKFGRLTVIERADDYISPKGYKSTQWKCVCDCGNICIIIGDSLKLGATKSCGCLQKEITSKNRLIDITGQKFGRLTVIERAEDYISSNGYKNTQWLCQCECGNITTIVGESLKNGSTKSCGCLAKETSTKHGLHNTRIYRIYQTIKNRCYTRSNTRYKDYGGRGIKVCDEWLDKDNGFMNFYNWAINNGYNDDLTIDRIDVNGNYESSNCRWANIKEQANNKRTNRYITYNNKTQTLKQWCEELNLNYNTINGRLNNYHWSVEEAFETPIKTRH